MVQTREAERVIDDEPRPAAVRGTCAVVLNWNQPALTLECVRHLEAAGSPVALPVVLVDNGSTARNLATLKAGLPFQCSLVQVANNLGFAEGMNVGLRHALAIGHEYVWLLNNDAFPTSDCLEHLVRAMDDCSKIAMVSPRLLYPDGREQHAGGRVDWASGKHVVGSADDLACDCKIGDWLTGTAPLIRLSAIKDVGLFDPRFFAYWEDVDLSTRFIRAGWAIRAVPAATCTHLGSASTGGEHSPFSNYLMTRNAWLFLRKHLPRKQQKASLLGLVTSRLEQAALFHAMGRPATAAAMVAGLTAIFRGETGRPCLASTPSFFDRLVLSHPWFLVRCLKLLRTGLKL
jgi:GT2 family glycosyltransferase